MKEMSRRWWRKDGEDQDSIEDEKDLADEMDVEDDEPEYYGEDGEP